MTAPHVVVGVDGSPASAAAAATGERLARLGGGRCQLVHATPDVRLELDLAGIGVSLEELQLAVSARVRGDIAAAMRDRVPADVLERLAVRTGRAATVLEEAVREIDAGWLVLGGKHHSVLGRWLGGSTVQRAVRRLPVPLLVTTDELPERPRVLVALDLSEAAPPTAHGALAFARLLGGALRAIHVLETERTIPEALLVIDPARYDAALRRRVAREVWPLLPIPDDAKVIRAGVAPEVIAEEAAAWRADVIVVGSHGKGWLDRLLIGSVTERLLNDLPAAMVVIPVPAPAAPEPRTAAPDAAGLMQHGAAV